MAYPDTNLIIERLLFTEEPLALVAAERLGQYRLLAATQQLNIEEIRAECNRLQVIANVVPLLENRIKELEEERDRLKFWWFDTLAEELAKGEYETAIANEDSVAIWELLSAKTIQSQPDPIPVDVVKRDLNNLLTKAYLHPTLDADTRSRWVGLCQAQVQMLDGKPVPRAVVEALKPLAVQAELILADYPVGLVTESRLDQLGLVGVVKGPNEIKRAMGW
jgi:hypothetical protein